MPVLYGVFLYMGVSSLQGIQVLYGSARAMSSHCALTCPDRGLGGGGGGVGGGQLQHKLVLEKPFPSLVVKLF